MTLCNAPSHSQNQHTANPHPLSSQQSQQSQQQQSLPPQNLHPNSIHSQHASFRGVSSSNNIPSHLIQHPQRGYTQASHHPQSHPQQNLMNMMTASSGLNSTYGCGGRPSPLMLQAPQSIHGLSSSHLSSQSNLPLPTSKASPSPGHSKYQQVGRPPFPLTTNSSLPPGLSPSQYGLNLNHFNPSMPSAPLLSSQSSYGRIPPAITTSNNSPHSTSRSNINNSSNNRTLITKVHKNDVLSGRGVNIAHHAGNERFRSLITTYLDNNYCTSYSASEKKAIALEIIIHIQALNPVGRFLRRDGRGQVSRGLSGPWEQLTQREAIKKTCQALRDCNRTDRSGYANGIDAPIDVIENKKRVKELGVSVKNLAEMAVVKNANASKQNNTVSVPASLKVPGSDGPRNASPGGTATGDNSTNTTEDRARGSDCSNHHHPHHRDAMFGTNSRNTLLNIPTNNSDLLNYNHAPLDPHAAHADLSRYTIASSSSTTLQQPVNPFQNMVPSSIPPHPSHASQSHSHHHGVGNYHHHHPRSLLHPPSGAVIPGVVLGQSQRSNNLNIHAPASSNNGTYRYHQRGGGSVSGNVGHNNSNNANNNSNQNNEIYTSTSGNTTSWPIPIIKNKTTDDTEPLSSSSTSAPNEEHAHEHNTHREHYNHEHHDEPTSPHRTVLLAGNVEGIRGNNENNNNKNRNENEDDTQDNLSIRSHMSNSDKMLLSSPHHHHSPHPQSLHQNHSPSSFEVGNEQNDGKDNNEDDVNLNVNINDDDDDDDEEEGHTINKTIEDDIAIDNWTNGPQHDTNGDNHVSSNILSQSLSSSPVITDDVMEADHHDFNVEVDELSNDDNDDVVDHHDVKFEGI